MIPSFQKPTLNFPSLTQAKKHLDVRALEALLKNWPDCQNSPEGRRFYRWIAPRAERASKKRSKSIIRRVDSKQQPIAKATPTLDKKKWLKEECEHLCKEIVFRRQGVSNNREDENYRMGNCITCKRWNKLQWGHFIEQSKCKFLQYHPDATGGQCGQCNGPGHGMYLEYRAAINARKPGLADQLERMHEETKGNFRWTVAGLEMQRDILKRLLAKRG